jgi:hypothetical protein
MIYIIIAVISLIISLLFDDRKGKSIFRAIVCDFSLVFSGILLFLGIEYYIAKDRPIFLNTKNINVKIDTVIENNDTVYIYKICKKIQEN